MVSALKISAKQRFERVLYFFPFRLLILHFKRNHFLLFFWFLLFGYTTNLLASRYGVVYQFLYPEYRGQSDFVAFAMFGFALGGFILAFNLYTYILHGFRFPFIATLNRPFMKFSLNNFMLPAIYLAVYIYCSVSFQLNQELLPVKHVIFNIAGLFTGMLFFLIVSLLYFNFTNKNAGSFSKHENDKNPIQSNLTKPKDWLIEDKKTSDWRVETYMVHWLKIGLARTSKHYDRSILEKVFSQNHVNASFFELGVLISFIIIGSFRENTWFLIPAAASLTLFFTVALMLISALFSWIKGWTFTVFILIFVIINFSVSGLNHFNIHSGAYGLDYTKPKAKYEQEQVLSSTDQSTVDQDIAETIERLENWKAKNTGPNGELPKLVIINASGGGLRSALWTTSSLLHADSITQGDLLDHTFMMTGSSGGMIGTSYVRELIHHRESKNQPFIIDEKEREIASDLLNPIMLTISTNDLFIRYQKFNDGASRFTKDRAYAFERQLDKNTNGILNKRLGEYAELEASGQIPMIVMAPSIVNDGRRLVISASPVSYLCDNDNKFILNGESYAEDIEFSRFFKDQMADSLQYLSALRMNATFPYILPVVSLPTEPEIGVMDAGLRDNFGLKTTYQFLYTFRDWINENTSGVVMVQVRDVMKKYVGDEQGGSLVSKFTAPLGSVYGNVTKIQNYNQDQMLKYLADGFDTPMEVVTFQLQSDPEQIASLSWHLTEVEKRAIEARSRDAELKAQFQHLKNLLNSQD